MDEITRTINSFTIKFITIPELWLRDCIDFFKQQGNTPADYTQSDLEQFVYMQWLLFDIREANVPVLPPDINEEKKYHLKDTITLQLLSVMDISRPKYSQIQAIRNKLEKPLESDIKEIEFKGASKRCLQLTLTDGVQEIQAFEYKPLNNLNLHLNPGMKIRFIAPMMVRYGQIMLQNESNVLLLGGEVEEILVSNAPENILAAALNLPLNNHPLSPLNPQANAINNCATVNNIKLTNKRENAKVINLNKDNFPAKHSNDIAKPISKVKTSAEDDEFDMLLEIENELHGNQNVINQTHTKAFSNKPKLSHHKDASANTAHQPHEEDIDYMLNLEDELEMEKASVDTKHDLREMAKCAMDVSFGINTNLKSKLSKAAVKSDTKESIADVMKKYKPFKSSPETIEIVSSPEDSPKKKPRANRDPYANPIPTTSRQIFKNPREPFISPILSKDALESPHRNTSPQKCVHLSTLSKTPITTGKFKVNAKFKMVVDKLTVKDNEWYIKLQIEDVSGTIDLAIDHILINKLMGFTRQEFKMLLQKGARKVQEAVDAFKIKLQSIDGILEIVFTNKIPQLINIF